MSFYAQVRNDNVDNYGKKVGNYIPIIINQYSDRTHFIYELLQNAEDAGANYIKFFLHHDKIEIRHNGRPFNERDVIGVCGIADGTKDDGTRIGHFGIGFKAVYGYTKSPMIYSGDFCFEIRDYLSPYEVSTCLEISKEETCMVLPFNKEGISEDIAYKEIREALTKKINADSILVLNNIEDIEIRIDGLDDIITINKAKGPKDSSGNVFDLNILTTYESKINGKKREHENNYLFFTDAEKEASAIIFRIEGNELQEVHNTKIYAFFPTAKESHQNFYIHAPFDTTPARDNFKEGAEFGKHNIQLVDNIGNLIAYAFIWMCDHGYLTISGMSKVFPIYRYEKDDILYGIYQSGIDLIRSGQPIIPTNHKGEFKAISSICVPENMSIVSVFDDDDLHSLINHSKFWIAKEISTRAYIEFKQYLDDNFEFQTLDWRSLVTKLSAAFLANKNQTWHSNLFSYIESFCTRRIGEQSSHYIDARKIPFVRLSDGKQEYAQDEEGKPNVYLNNPDICKLRIDSNFVKNEIIRSFYERALGIKEYNIERETIDKILPKYASANVIFNTNDHMKENIRDLKAIKDAMTMNPSVSDKVRESYVVTDGTKWYKPTQLYIRDNDPRSGYNLVKGIVSIRFLSQAYFDDTVMSIRLDEAFFKSIGCSAGIRIVHADYRDYLDAVEKYVSRDERKRLLQAIFSKKYVSEKLDWSFNFEGFPQVFENIDKQKSLAIARFLNNKVSLFDMKGDLVGADDQHFSGSNVDSATVYTMLGLFLSLEKWIYISNDSEPYRPIDIDKDQVDEQYKPYRQLLRNLPFKELNNAVSEYLNNAIDNPEARELIERFIKNPDEAAEFAKAYNKSKAREAAKESKKGSIRDKIKGADRSQARTSSDNDDGPNYAPITEKGLEKRTKSLEEALKASMDNKTSVSKGLHFTSRSCNEAERAFLEEQYQGYCQICQTKIEKHDGSDYFEAINIIKHSEMYDKDMGALNLAWNALCLCPNCAARYNYSSKKISDLYEQVMENTIEPDSEDPVRIKIELPLGQPQSISYSARHFLALQEALKFYSES